MRSRPQHDAVRRLFLHRGIHGQEKSASIYCWRKTVPMIRARSVRRLSLSVHCAFISLNAG
jgi:hypothetical protein